MGAGCLRRAHPEAEKKIGAGVKTFQIRNHPEHDTRCYMVMRVDGTCEDFSYRKCVEILFPGYSHPVRAAGGRGRCRFWNAGNCIYGNQCNFEHRNLVDGSNRPAISTFAPGTAFTG